MRIISYLMSGVLFLYGGYYCYKMFRPLLRYRRAVKRGALRDIAGNVFGKYGEEKRNIRGNIVESFYPKYQFYIDGDQRIHNGIVRYSDIEIGRFVTVFYDDGSGEAWVKEDLPLMKKQALRWMLILLILSVFMILSGQLY